MFIEVDSNPNSESSVFLRFKDLGPPKPLLQVKSYERTSKGEWCFVVGWSDDPDNPVCQAQAQPIEDSGMGLGYIVFGGICGIRLKPVSLQEDWDIESPNQWGEAYLSLADERDLLYQEM